MADDLIERLRAGLEGVTAGPWRPGHLADDTSPCNCTSILAENGLMGSIANVTVDNGLRVGEGGNDGPPVEEAKRNLLHIANCSPDNIRALLDALASKDKALEEMRTELDACRCQRNEIGKAWDACDSERKELRAELERRDRLIDRAKAIVPETYVNWHAAASAQ